MAPTRALIALAHLALASALSVGGAWAIPNEPEESISRHDGHQGLGIKDVPSHPTPERKLTPEAEAIELKLSLIHSDLLPLLQELRRAPRLTELNCSSNPESGARRPPRRMRDGARRAAF